LTAALVGRPVIAGTAPCYARLSLPYVGAVVLRRGELRLEDFTLAVLVDRATLALAQRIAVVDDGNPDPNALAPQRVEIDLKAGPRLENRDRLEHFRAKSAADRRKEVVMPGSVLVDPGHDGIRLAASKRPQPVFSFSGQPCVTGE
jgi:hypothetical protein